MKSLIVLASVLAAEAFADDNSHGYIVSTRNGSSYFAEQKYIQGVSEAIKEELYQSAFGKEFFGFWRNSVTTNILHKYLTDPFIDKTYFLVGNGVGIESKATFSSPLVNIGLLGGGNINLYKIPEFSDKKMSSVQTYGGLMLERFWSYKVSFGALIRTGKEKFSYKELDTQNLQEIGVFINFWDK